MTDLIGRSNQGSHAIRESAQLCTQLSILSERISSSASLEPLAYRDRLFGSRVYYSVGSRKVSSPVYFLPTAFALTAVTVLYLLLVPSARVEFPQRAGRTISSTLCEPTQLVLNPPAP